MRSSSRGAGGVDPAYERLYGRQNAARPDNRSHISAPQPPPAVNAPVRAPTSKGGLSIQDLIAASKAAALKSSAPTSSSTDPQSNTLLTEQSKAVNNIRSQPKQVASRWDESPERAQTTPTNTEIRAATTAAAAPTAYKTATASAPVRRTLDEDSIFPAISGTKRARSEMSPSVPPADEEPAPLRSAPQQQQQPHTNHAEKAEQLQRERYSSAAQLVQRALIHGCRSVTCYRPLERIDEGTYGVVFSAEDTKTNEKVALKKVKMDKISSNEGFPITALRETNILLMLRHPNIITVKEMVVGRDIDKVYMVMEFMDHDVKALMSTMTQCFTQAELKCLMQQLLAGVAHMHDRWIIHRDLKTSNLLMDNAGRLCICDFGLARKYSEPIKPYTREVVTQWYRAPELLLGCKVYSTAIDMWSVGCIFAEFITKKPLFPGTSETDQLNRIFRLLGTPVDEDWPSWSSLPGSTAFSSRTMAPQSLRHALGLGTTPYGGAPFISESGLELLQGLLSLNPDNRMSAQEALAHRWFEESPPAADPRLMPAFPSARDKAKYAGAATPEYIKAHGRAASHAEE